MRDGDAACARPCRLRCDVGGVCRPEVFQALITTIVHDHDRASASSTTLVSSCGCGARARGRAARPPLESSPATNRELYSSTYSWPSRPR